MKTTKYVYKTMKATVDVFETIDRKGWREMRIDHPELKRRFLAPRRESEGGTINEKVKNAVEKQFGELLYVITISQTGSL